MKKTELAGNVIALLDEYKKAIDELIVVIKPLSENKLTTIVDDTTTDPDCKSIQAILAHVVCSGYNYTVAMENHLGHYKPRREREVADSADIYISRLNDMYAYCCEFFYANPTVQIEQIDSAKKITVSWGQQFDIEQLMEHAIVHILRHRRQVVNFAGKLNTGS